ncbi:MAG: hypothetical protein WC546_03235 [Candidatus Omnitrophota bacterium]
MPGQKLNISICTLFEKDYHYGLAALANSLYVHNYRGIIWAGYRGLLPAWLPNKKSKEKWIEVEVAQDFIIRFVEIDTQMHFANYKPTWMLSVFNNLDANCGMLFYFDPDITVNYNWDFFSKWAASGVALCQDVNYFMPADHPRRKEWQRFIQNKGFYIRSKLNNYFNSGFVGLKREYIGFLIQWEKLMALIGEQGMDTGSLRKLNPSGMFTTLDQDALNIIAMITEYPLSTVGPEGMGFIPGSFMMAHAISLPKPWDKKMALNSLIGQPLRRADKEYFKYTQYPIQFFSKWQLFWRKVDLKIASAINRVAARR